MSIVEAIEVVKAIQRIPEEYRNRYTFFSEWDIWEYVPVIDDNTCPICLGHKEVEYPGSKIRLIFPYLEIITPDLIMVHEHPNCRCTLVWRGFKTIGEE